MSLFLLGLDLGRVEQGRDDRRRANPDRDTGFDQLRSPLFARVVFGFVAHSIIPFRGGEPTSMGLAPAWEAGL